MADITKRVDRGIFPTSRTQNFTDADASEGDVLLVRDSLGHSASTVTIEADATFAVRFNVYRTLYPLHKEFGDGLTNIDHLPNVTSGVSYKSSEPALVTVEAGSVYSLQNEIPVADIELVTASGVTFDIFVA